MEWVLVAIGIVAVWLARNFLIGLITPTRFSTRAYMERQLAHYGVPKGRLSRECVQDLADDAVRMEKLRARVGRRHWSERVTDTIEGHAVNVARYLEGKCPDDRITNPVHEILVKHSALPVRADRPPLMQDDEALKLGNHFFSIMDKVKALKGEERASFSTIISTITDNHEGRIGGNTGFSALNSEEQYAEIGALRDMENAMRNKSMPPLDDASALACHAYRILLLALMANETGLAEYITDELRPYIEAGVLHDFS